MSIDKAFDPLNEYIWDDSDETLEDVLYWAKAPSPGDDTKPLYFERGDIVMLSEEFSGKGRHKLLLITGTLYENNILRYEGYIISQDVQAANIRNREYPKNIYIKNYQTILKTGIKVEREAIISLDDKIVAGDEDFEKDNPLKGHCRKVFMGFVRNEISKMEKDIDTSGDSWS